MERFLIFGVLPNGKLGHPIARGIIRHAWGHVYRRFTKVQTEDLPWDPQAVVRETIRTVVSAARTAMETRRRARLHTLTHNVPDSNTRLDPLIHCKADGGYGFHTVILDAMDFYELE